jgi:NAD-dependent histone deacetylase SIR2
MAAQAHAAAGAASEVPARTEAAGGGGGVEADDAPAGTRDDDDDEAEGAVWETASLFEEILDDVAAFEYSGSGKSPTRSASSRMKLQHALRRHARN